jgi:hypothetical protein
MKGRQYCIENTPIISLSLGGEGGGEGVRHTIHPHLNPPPSRGRIILANFHGSCLHAEVDYGTQAWQSHWKRRDCFGSLAMTISISGFGVKHFLEKRLKKW